MAAQFEGDYKLTFQLAPPLSNKPDAVTGEAKKSVYGPWMMSAFRLLAKMKGLGGTALDVVGKTAGRRMERQIITDYDPATSTGHGFLFYEYGSEPFWDAIKRTCEVFRQRKEWERLMKRAITQDFSWAKAAERYEELYGTLVAQGKRAA